jgi:hypothetical protein
MRSTKLTAALAAASALLAVAPGAAGARQATHALTGAKPHCRVYLIAEPRTIVSGEPAQLFGKLTCAGGGEEKQPVIVYGRTAGSPTFKVIAEKTTETGGFYTLVQPGITADSFYYVRALGARSGSKSVRVAPVVKLEGPPTGTTLLTGSKNKVTFSGTVTPADEGAEVLLERENSGSSEEWSAIQRGIVVKGKYKLEHGFAIPGSADLRTIVRPHGSFTVRGTSETLSYGISQRQNLNLLIHTSSYTVPFETPVTISGVLKEGAGKTITLLAHTEGKPVETVSTVKAGLGGSYEFKETPLNNTLYQVTGGSQKSAALFQGVKYVLTPIAPATTVEDGQALTFLGKVSPALEGKKVYLQRENLFAGGFHVADLGVVGAGGSYSIAHSFFGVGKQVYRIKVPGDRLNQSMSSAPFTIEVTSVPPKALKPAAPAKQPQ